MEKPDKEVLSRVIGQMEKKNICEVFETLLIASPYLALKVSFDDLHFSPDDPYGMFPLPLKSIYSVYLDGKYLYILCYNQNLHIIGLTELGHLLLSLNQPSQCEMFCWMCRSYWDRLKK